MVRSEKQKVHKIGKPEVSFNFLFLIGITELAVQQESLQAEMEALGKKIVPLVKEEKSIHTW